MRPPIAANWLGLAGLLPFFAAALAAVFASGETAALGRQALILYGGVILSFMGGCRWGFAAAGLGEGPTLKSLGFSVLPALLGFFVLLGTLADGAAIEFQAAATVLALGFAALFLADRSDSKSGAAPEWWAKLRLPLTMGACASLLSASLT